MKREVFLIIYTVLYIESVHYKTNVMSWMLMFKIIQYDQKLLGNF